MPHTEMLIHGFLKHGMAADAFYIEHHVSDVDSFVVDQVNGVFDNEGKNFAQAYDVAGVTGATGNSVLVRKFQC